MPALPLILIVWFVGVSSPAEFPLAREACLSLEAEWKAGNIKTFVFRHEELAVERMGCVVPLVDESECGEVERL